MFFLPCKTPLNKYLFSIKKGDLLSIDSADLFAKLSKTNNDKGLTKAKFTVKDIEYCIELGKDLP